MNWAGTGKDEEGDGMAENVIGGNRHDIAPIPSVETKVRVLGDFVEWLCY